MVLIPHFDHDHIVKRTTSTSGQAMGLLRCLSVLYSSPSSASSKISNFIVHSSTSNQLDAW